jgi:hypothetical protein
MTLGSLVTILYLPIIRHDSELELAALTPEQQQELETKCRENECGVGDHVRVAVDYSLPVRFLRGKPAGSGAALLSLDATLVRTENGVSWAYNGGEKMPHIRLSSFLRRQTEKDRKIYDKQKEQVMVLIYKNSA